MKSSAVLCKEIKPGTYLGFKFCFERFPPFLLLFPAFDFRVSVLPLFQKLLGLKAEFRLPVLVFPAAAAQGRGWAHARAAENVQIRLLQLTSEVSA
jgi:hypothetical protein